MSYYSKPAILPCSIFSNSGHVDWCTASPDTILKLDTLLMIQTKFGFNWSSSFREDLWKSLQRTTDDDDRCQVMAIAHLAFWARWAKKGHNSGKVNVKYTVIELNLYLMVHSIVLKCEKIWLSHTLNIIQKPKKSLFSRRKRAITHKW
jgi:hypothetical protein